MAQVTVINNSPNVKDIPLDLIVADPKKNYRTMQDPKELEQLQESMKRQGQLQTVEVVQLDNGKFELILGFRRFACAKALEWSTIRAEVVTGKDGKPLAELDRRLRNATENLARENLTPYDQALAFMDLKKVYDMSANLIGQNVGKSVSYINNLTRVLEGIDESIAKRWKEESHPMFGLDKEGKRIPNIRQVCTMNWLTDLLKVPRADQEMELKKALGLVPDEDDDDDDDDDSGREPAQPGANKKPSTKNLQSALEAAKKMRKDASGDDKGLYEGMVQALRYAIGEVQSIKGVYTNPKPGETVKKSKGDDN